MISNTVKKKGILAKLLEQCMKILLIKECKKISNIKIDIISSTTNIVKGDIQKINLSAKGVDYKDLLFDEVKLEAQNLKINFQIKKRELHFKNDPIVKFKISLSQNSLKRFLLSKNWNWIKNLISNNLLNQAKLESVKLNNDQLLINTIKEKNKFNSPAQIEIIADKGKIYLTNRNHKKNVQIPIEEKIHIENIYIENNIINIFGNSSISF
tara:strand:- start:190 stop:822 length:633 start_codon:yes stop_codon:yes gene_type:complete